MSFHIGKVFDINSVCTALMKLERGCESIYPFISEFSIYKRCHLLIGDCLVAIDQIDRVETKKARIDLPTVDGAEIGKSPPLSFSCFAPHFNIAPNDIIRKR